MVQGSPDKDVYKRQLHTQGTVVLAVAGTADAGAFLPQLTACLLYTSVRAWVVRPAHIRISTVTGPTASATQALTARKKEDSHE